ncbi:SusC/RagA family TonB-linked outer membrane protein [Polaribacter ponticola]|uniref:SusC/RagA family TonB-linked outer membrane protein n=1 Tax=Polaribacter ponticola TaxID=2978475 RepID=A0ABT5SB97_9FLAO|nr:SusC/RagA family TonB-linked outer membrane protein [Polaribacter sp. MSW5]MDD7914746.1 SusC/RagA family TonB-linked outer membrane protein [Polaribacter sp. MSW5]
MKTKFNGILTLLLALVVQISFAQEKTISGTVTEESGALPGVSVLIKGTSNGTETDFDGKFSIKAKTGDVLVFSYLGYKAVEKTVRSSSVINVTMAVDSNVLDEVVVTALGIKRAKRETVYQTESVSSEELLKSQPTSAASALAGKVAGLQINVQNNGVDPTSQILLRGLRSLTQSNSALIVLDGSVSTQGAFDQLNPNDIESINTLKGATASALYGSRAANGVIIVNTKQGNGSGKLTVGINTTTTIEEIAYTPEFQDEYGTGWQGAYEAIENTNWGPKFDGKIRRIGPIYTDGSYQTAPYASSINNVEEFYDKGATYQNTIYFTGGNENSRYYMSIGDQRTTGIIPGDTYKKNTFRVNASQTFGNVKLSMNTSFFVDNKDIVGDEIGSQNRNLYWFILNTSNNINLKSYKNWKTDFYASPNGFYNGYYQNPYWAIDTNRDTDRRNRLTSNITASWDVADWLNITGRVGINRSSGTGKEWRAAQQYDTSDMIADVSRPDDVSSWVQDSEFQSSQYTSELIASSEFELNKDFDLKALAGFTSFSSSYRDSNYRANNLSIPGFYDLSNGTGQLVGDFVDESQKRTFGVFADLTLGYKNYLFLNVSGRNDWTSTLDQDNNSYFYPSAGLSFVATDAIEALKESDIINYLKLTLSHTVTYNDIGAYAINETYGQSSGFPFGDQNGFFVNGTAVADEIKKEEVSSSEFGLNAAFLNNRFTMDFAYYRTTTKDLITTATTANSAGSTAFLTNIGQIDGDGIELTLGGTPIRTGGGFEWNMDVNYTSSNQKVNNIGEGVSEVGIRTLGDYGIYAVVGEDFPLIKASSYVRDPNGNVVVSAVDGNPIIGGLKNLGKTTPDYIIGLNNSFSYKGFTLGATMDYRTGHVYYSQLADNMEFTGRSIESASANRQDFVFPNSVINTGTDAAPVYVANNNITVTAGNQDFWTGRYNDIKENYVKDATSLKLRELSFGYTFPAKYLTNTGFSKMSFTLVGRNLFTWLPKENRFSDPEFNNTNNNAIGLGGYLQSPPTRTFGFNVNLEF